VSGFVELQSKRLMRLVRLGCSLPPMLRLRLVVGTVVLCALGCTAKSGAGDEMSTPTSGEACTDIGCMDGLLIQVTPIEAWPHGDYLFSIEHDGTTTTCEGSLPLPACETRAISCDGSEPLITESGCALDPAAHAFGDIMFTTTPAAVTVEVSIDGETVGTGSFDPEYQTIQPNGPGCEPICTTAAVDLALSF
jgi:hypothetical protein